MDYRDRLRAIKRDKKKHNTPTTSRDSAVDSSGGTGEKLKTPQNPVDTIDKNPLPPPETIHVYHVAVDTSTETDREMWARMDDGDPLNHYDQYLHDLVIFAGPEGLDFEEWYEKGVRAFRGQDLSEEEENLNFVIYHCRLLNRRMVTMVGKNEKGTLVFVASHPQIAFLHPSVGRGTDPYARGPKPVKWEDPPWWERESRARKK